MYIFFCKIKNSYYKWNYSYLKSSNGFLNTYLKYLLYFLSKNTYTKMFIPCDKKSIEFENKINIKIYDLLIELITKNDIVSGRLPIRKNIVMQVIILVMFLLALVARKFETLLSWSESTALDDLDDARLVFEMK